MLARILVAVLSLFCIVSSAQESQDVSESPVSRAYKNAVASATAGPAQVALQDQAKLSLPADFLFIPKSSAATFLSAMGNFPGDDLLGLIVSKDPDSNWMVVARFEKSGYIKDDDAKEWNADDLLKSLKEGTENQNEERRKQGIPEFVVAGWVQPPTYDAKAHRLVWSAETRDKQPTNDNGAGVNYNTYALGRDGYVSLNLVTDLRSIEADKPIANTLLSGLQFNSGKRYEEFNANTDHIAEFGLAALVGGVAAKKLGLFAVAAAFVMKFIKVIAVACVGGVAAIRKVLGRKSEQ